MGKGPTEIFNIADLIGLTEKKALAKIKAAGFSARVMRRDQEGFGGDCSFIRSRVNLEIDNGKVTKADIG